MLRLHYIQHIKNEGPNKIYQWAKEKKNIQISKTLLYKNQSFPDINDFDWLIIMGGSMGVDDEKQFPWLKKEKVFIRNSIKANKAILGICLGSQLIISSLNGKINKGLSVEQGWFPIKKTSSHPLFSPLPNFLTPLHLHSDSFEIPKNFQLIYKSKVCNQAFIYKNNVIGLQFHLEMSPSRVERILNELEFKKSEGAHIQSKEEILSSQSLFQKSTNILYKFLDHIIKSLFSPL